MIFTKVAAIAIFVITEDVFEIEKVTVFPLVLDILLKTFWNSKQPVPSYQTIDLAVA